MAKQIMIVLHANGKIEANLAGYKGRECDQEKLLEEIQALLAPETKTEQRKPEYYQTQQQAQQARR